MKTDYEALYKVQAEKNARGSIIEDWFRWGKIRGPEYDQFKEAVLTLVEDTKYNKEEIEELEEVQVEYEAVKKALVKLSELMGENEEDTKYTNMIEELAEGEIPEELKDKPKKKVKK